MIWLFRGFPSDWFRTQRRATSSKTLPGRDQLHVPLFSAAGQAGPFRRSGAMLPGEWDDCGRGHGPTWHQATLSLAMLSPSCVPVSPSFLQFGFPPVWFPFHRPSKKGLRFLFRVPKRWPSTGEPARSGGESSTVMGFDLWRPDSDAPTELWANRGRRRMFTLPPNLQGKVFGPSIVPGTR